MSKQKQADVVTVRIPRDLAARIDEAADGVPRERWVRRALEKLLVPEGGRAPIRPGRTDSPRDFHDAVFQASVDASVGASAPAKRRAEVLVGEGTVAGLTQFRCTVCGLKTIGGPCAKHGASHSEAL